MYAALLVSYSYSMVTTSVWTVPSSSSQSLGAMGEVMSYRVAAALLAGAAFAAMLLFIVRNRKDVEPIYNLRV